MTMAKASNLEMSIKSSLYLCQCIFYHLRHVVLDIDIALTIRHVFGGET